MKYNVSFYYFSSLNLHFNRIKNGNTILFEQVNDELTRWRICFAFYFFSFLIDFKFDHFFMEVKNNNLEVNSSQCVTRIIFGEVIAALHRTICVWLSVIVMCSAFQFVQKHLEGELIRNVVGEKKNNFHVNPVLISIWFEWRKKSCQYLLVCVCVCARQTIFFRIKAKSNNNNRTHIYSCFKTTKDNRGNIKQCMILVWPLMCA